MKFRVSGSGWPLDQWLLPNGTVIDTDASDLWSTIVRERGLPPPIDATPLDQAAWQAQVDAYPGHTHLLSPWPPPTKVAENSKEQEVATEPDKLARKTKSKST